MREAGNKKINTKNIAILVMLIFTLTLISGCSQAGSTAKYRVGTEGLVMEFSKANPKNVYEGEQFGTSLFVKNMGSYDIVDRYNPAQLTITYDDYRLEFIQNQDSASTTNIWLRAKSQYFPVGEEAPVAFYFNSKRLTHLRENSVTSINYNLCFPYQTELTTMTCIDTKAANNDDSAAACASELYSGGSGQGAPIVITKIEPEILLQPNYVRPQFKIYIENRGNGYVANSEKCDQTNINDIETSGRVSIKAWLSSELLDCGPDNMGEVRVVDGESYIKCSLPNTDNRYSRTKKNYVTPLTIRLSYTYTVIEKQELEIKRNELLTQEVTQGTCNSYQVEFQGSCVTKCEYCAKYPEDKTNCYISPSAVPAGVNTQFAPNFACTCKIAECDVKAKDGNCIKGFCPGGLYCCSNSQCSAWQVEYNGQCIDKCDYCRDHPTDNIHCNGINITNAGGTKNFGCYCVLADKGKMPTGDFISDTSFCRANAYCCNTMAITTV